MSGARSPVHRACSFPPREGGKLAAPCVRGCARPGPCHGVWLLFAGLAFIRVPAGPRGEPSRFPALIRCPAFTWPPSVLGAPEIGRAQGPSSLPAWGPALGAAAGRLGDLCLQGPDRPPEGGRAPPQSGASTGLPTSFPLSSSHRPAASDPHQLTPSTVLPTLPVPHTGLCQPLLPARPT